MEEIEVKFLGIDPDEIEKKLLALGAIKKYDAIFEDKVFDFPGFPLQTKTSWLRLRRKYQKITLSFKHWSPEKMEETEVEVSNFDKTADILFSIGMVFKFHEEKRRIHFELDSVDVDIDTWPLLKPYLEIEGKNWDEVRSVSEKLGLDWEKRLIDGAMNIYRMNGINEMDYQVLTFDKQIKRNA